MVDNRFFRPLAPLVMPAVYDDVLSYEEWLSKVVYKINELTDYINKQLADVEVLVNEEVKAQLAEMSAKYDAEIADLKGQVTEVRAEMSDLDASVNLRIDSLKTYIDEEILKLKLNFNEEIHNFFIQNKLYTDGKVAAERIARRADLNAINARLDSYVREWPLVYCPPLGRYTDVESALVEVWDSLRMFALTASEYDNFDFTAKEYEDLLLQAFEYDVYGGYILRENIKQMFNPFTGKHENIRNVVNDICDYLKFNGKTAAEYDAYEFTASQFDASDFTAFPQDSNKYWTTPAADVKNKYFKNYVKMFEDPDAVSQEAGSTSAEYTGKTKGFIFYIQPDSSSAVETVELSGVGSYRVENDNGYRDITISKSADLYTIQYTDNTDHGNQTDNSKNIIRAAYRIGGAYDVTELDT